MVSMSSKQGSGVSITPARGGAAGNAVPDAVPRARRKIDGPAAE
jgi:hypothetical protein